MNAFQARERVTQLIVEGAALDSADSRQFRQWVESSYKAVEPFAFSQLQFNTYCRSSTDKPKMRVQIGLHLLRLAVSGTRD
jgi:hypothetical protein